MQLLLEGIFEQYGFDFRSYAYASVRRRLWKRIEAEGLATISGLQERVLHEPADDGATAARPLHQRHGDVP